MNISTLKSVLVNAGHIGAARIFDTVARVIYVIVLARLLGPELYGFFAYSQAWYLSFIPIASLGGLFLFSRDQKPDQEHIRSILPVTLALRLNAIVMVAVASGVSGWLLEDNPEIQILLLMFMIALMARAISNVMTQLFVFYEQAQFVPRQEALFRSFELAAGITMLSLGAGIFELGIVHTTSWVLQAIRSVRIANGIEAIHLRFAWREMFEMLAKRGLAAGAGTALVTWLVQGPLVLSRHTEALIPDLGNIALALISFNIAAIAPMAVSAAAFPVLVRSIAREDNMDVTYVAAMCRATILFGAVASLAGFALGPALITFLLGEPFALAGDLLGYSLWLIIPHVIAASVGPLLVVRGRYAAQFWRAVFGVGAMALSFPYSVAWLGAHGVILSAGIGLCVSAGTQMTFLVHTQKLDLNLAILRPGLAAIASLAAYLILEPLLGQYWAMVGGLVTLAVAAFAFKVFTKQERRAVAERLNEFRGKSGQP